MRILIIGDIVGRPGRRALAAHAAGIRDEYKVDLFIANAENCAGGSGITPETGKELLASGIDVLTSGDHIFQQKSAVQALENPRILRPLNYPAGAPGKGWTTVETAAGITVAVVNLLGRVFMKPLDCPFRAIDGVLEEIYSETRNIIVDMHAEATSEKIAMGWFLNGRVSGVCGTHTHVLTADARILSEGTAYITDLGMTGARASVLGRDIEPVLAHFLTGMPQRFKVAERDNYLNGALIDIDETSGRARGIEIIQRNIEST